MKNLIFKRLRSNGRVFLLSIKTRKSVPTDFIVATAFTPSHLAKYKGAALGPTHAPNGEGRAVEQKLLRILEDRAPGTVRGNEGPLLVSGLPRVLMRLALALTHTLII